MDANAPRKRSTVCAPSDDPVYEPCGATCEKCGSDDILIRWHEKRAKNQRPSCRDHMSVLDFGRLPESREEHLHFHCRRCQFIWLGPVLARAGAGS